MAGTEDPIRQLSFLQQCLASDKKPLALFLGAGCPVAVPHNRERDKPLIPDITGISQIVRSELGQGDNCKELLGIVEDHFEQDQRSSRNVEDILSHIRALRSVAGNGQVRGFSAATLDQLDDKICELIYDVVSVPLPHMETPYHAVASWIDAIRREGPVEVYTPNYDLLIEQAFEEFRVPYFDGFAGVREPFFDLRAMEEDSLPPRWARLWKLHGSINWYLGKNNTCASRALRLPLAQGSIGRGRAAIGKIQTWHLAISDDRRRGAHRH